MLRLLHSGLERRVECRSFKALPAYERAIRLLPKDVSVLSGYAEALASTNNHVKAR